MAEVGFTGTRKGLTCKQRTILDKELVGVSILHHGDCEGGDWEAWRLATIRGIKVICHPPENPRLRAWTKNDEEREPLPYRERNQKIVEESERLIACPAQPFTYPGSGTWATIRMTRLAKKPLLIIFPDGTFKREQPEEK